ncbi:MAG: DNA polymerase III subunit beta [Defluviitaleaceae bacterium]|nr:DNA polymerase III subunit beta [Defluviitaleaceae bacterium]MCL2239764.1 DNA polymerase III subunit beta [Defluviitaleaceae bacterium]
MKLNCDKGILLEGLNLVGRAVSARTTKPILECVLLFTQTHKGLTLCGNDLEMSITTAVMEADVEVPGMIALNAKLFTDIVRKMPGDVIQIEVDEKGVAEVTSGRARMKIFGLPGEEFPLIPEHELEHVSVRHRMKTTTLRDMIRHTIFSVSMDQSKLILTGELFDIKGGLLQVVSVDMHRISYRSHVFSPPEQGEHSAVIPARALHELSRVLPGDEEAEVTFYFTDNRVVFDTADFTFVSRLLVGDFIRYDQIFNEDFNTLLTVGRAELLNSLERALLVAGENKLVPIKLEMTETELIVTASTAERGHAHDEIPCEREGQDLIIYFNPRYIIDALRAIDEDKVVIKFTGAKSACTVRGLVTETEDGTTVPIGSKTARDDQKYLIVPLRGPA